MAKITFNTTAENAAIILTVASERRMSLDEFINIALSKEILRSKYKDKFTIPESSESDIKDVNDILDELKKEAVESM